jgi:hypothetical protein
MDENASQTPWTAEGYATVQEWANAKGGDIEDIVLVGGIPTVMLPSGGKRVQRICRRLAVSPAFSNLTMFLIISNTALMVGTDGSCSPRHRMPLFSRNHDSILA